MKAEIKEDTETEDMETTGVGMKIIGAMIKREKTKRGRLTSTMMIQASMPIQKGRWSPMTIYFEQE
jgi:hypothetical protein